MTNFDYVLHPDSYHSQKAYYFISTTSISSALNQIEPCTITNLQIAPNLDSGCTKTLRFWEMEIEGKPSLSFSVLPMNITMRSTISL